MGRSGKGVVAAVAAALTCIAGCDRESAERAGDELGEAGENVGEAVENVGEAIQEAASPEDSPPPASDPPPEPQRK